MIGLSLLPRQKKQKTVFMNNKKPNGSQAHMTRRIDARKASSAEEWDRQHWAEHRRADLNEETLKDAAMQAARVRERFRIPDDEFDPSMGSLQERYLHPENV